MGSSRPVEERCSNTTIFALLLAISYENIGRYLYIFEVK